MGPRDPRYAAWEAMMVGCAAVDRRTWIDPAHALEITLARGSHPGAGLMLQFTSAQAAKQYFTAFTEQLRACPRTQQGATPAVQPVVDAPSRWAGRRVLPGAAPYAEFASLNGAVVRLWALQTSLSDAEMASLSRELAA